MTDRVLSSILPTLVNEIVHYELGIIIMGVDKSLLCDHSDTICSVYLNDKCDQK